MGWDRAWLAVLLLGMGFRWPGQRERVVGELTRAVTPRDKRDALRLLGQHDDVPEDALRPFTEDPDPGVRYEAYRLLGRAPADDPSAEVRTLSPSLDDPDPRVRLAAVRAGASTEALIARLDDDILEVRIAAAHALADRPTATLALAAHVEAALPELRTAVVGALAHGAVEPETEPLLARALRDPDAQVALAALRAYARHPELALPAAVRELANAADPQLARAAGDLLGPARSWDDPAWLRALEHTADGELPATKLLEALEATLPRGEVRATEPLLAWLARAPGALATRIAALVARSEGVVEATMIVPTALTLPLLARARQPHSLDVLMGSLAQAGEGALALARDPGRVGMLASHYTRAALPVLAAADTLPASEELTRALRRALSEDAPTAALALRALGAMRVSVLSALDDPSPAIAIAALRGSVHDRSRAARDKRMQLVHAASGPIASSALTASVLAGDQLDVPWLEAQHHAAWPLGEVAAWALQFSSLGAHARTVEVDARYLPARAHHAPRALRTAAPVPLISWPDASGRVDWPSLQVVNDTTPWPRGSER